MGSRSASEQSPEGYAPGVGSRERRGRDGPRQSGLPPLSVRAACAHLRRTKHVEMRNRGRARPAQRDQKLGTSPFDKPRLNAGDPPAAPHPEGHRGVRAHCMRRLIRHEKESRVAGKAMTPAIVRRRRVYVFIRSRGADGERVGAERVKGATILRVRIHRSAWVQEGRHRTFRRARCKETYAKRRSFRKRFRNALRSGSGVECDRPLFGRGSRMCT